jgi:hypothetical protein
MHVHQIKRQIKDEFKIYVEYFLDQSVICGKYIWYGDYSRIRFWRFPNKMSWVPLVLICYLFFYIYFGKQIVSIYFFFFFFWDKKMWVPKHKWWVQDFPKWVASFSLTRVNLCILATQVCETCLQQSSPLSGSGLTHSLLFNTMTPVWSKLVLPVFHTFYFKKS